MLVSRGGFEPPVSWVTVRCFTTQLPRTCTGSVSGTRTPIRCLRNSRPTVRRTRNVCCAESAPGEIRTPDLPGRSRPLYPLNYGRISWVGLRGRDSNPRPGGYGPPALAAKLPRIVPCGVEGETRTRKAPGGQQALDLPRLPLRHFDISKLVPEGRFELPLAEASTV